MLYNVTIEAFLLFFESPNIMGDLWNFFKTSKVFDLTPRLINIEHTSANPQVFDLRPTQGKIEHRTFFKKKGPRDHNTIQFDVVTPRAIIHPHYSVQKICENHL